MMKWGEEKGKYKGLSGKKLVEACCVNGVINWDCSYILMTGYESKNKIYKRASTRKTVIKNV